MPLGITPAALRGIAAAVMAAAIFGAGWHLGGAGPAQELAELRGLMAAAAQAAEAWARQQEQDWAARAAAVESNYESKRQALATDLAAARRDSERLRRAIAAYTDRPADPAGAACGPDDRARTLGALLAEADELASESAAAADAEGERVKAWQAWARSTN